MLTSTHRSLPSFLGHFNVCLLQTLIFNKRKRNGLEGGQGEEEEKEMRKEKMGEEGWRKVGREKMGEGRGRKNGRGGKKEEGKDGRGGRKEGKDERRE